MAGRSRAAVRSASAAGQATGDRRGEMLTNARFPGTIPMIKRRFHRRRRGIARRPPEDRIPPAHLTRH